MTKMTQPEIQRLVDEFHACYSEALGVTLPLSLGRRTCWERLVVEGYTVDDLQAVLKRWTCEIRKGMTAGVLRFSRITDVDRFGEDLALARAEQKIRRGVSAKDKALRELRPVACEPVDTKAAQHGRDVALKALEQLRNDIGGN